MDVTALLLVGLSVIFSYNILTGIDAQPSVAPTQAGASGSESPKGTEATTPNPCPANCKKINRFTCGDWVEHTDGSNNTIWNWNGKYCSLTTERRSWMLSQNCVPFQSQNDRIFWTKEDCRSICGPCIR